MALAQIVQNATDFRYDFWCQKTLPSNIIVDCLLPYGIIIPLEVSKDATISDIKEDLWEEATHYPLFGLLKGISLYVFVCCNLTTKTEILDESRCLSEIQPFLNILKVVEISSNHSERAFDETMGLLIGKKLSEFEFLKSPEVNHFRWRAKLLAEEYIQSQKLMPWENKIMQIYPIRVGKIPKYLLETCIDSRIIINFRFENNNEHITKISFPLYVKPIDLLQEFIKKYSLKFLFKDEENPNDYILKVCGREELIFGDFEISTFLYFQEMMCKNKVPSLIVKMRSNFVVPDYNSYQTIEQTEMKSRQSFSTLTLGRKKTKPVSAWTIQDQFSLRINEVDKINVDPQAFTLVGIAVGIYHGGECLSEILFAKELAPNNGKCVWEEELVFPISIANLPRMTKLCITLYEASRASKLKNSRKSKISRQDLSKTSLAWVNTTIYDFRDQLKGGTVCFNMWNIAEDVSDSLLQPLGNVVSNPSTDDPTTITVTFPRHPNECTIMYPSLETIVDVGKQKLIEETNQSEVRYSPTHDGQGFSPGNFDVSSDNNHLANMRELEVICSKDLLMELHEQDKKLMWSHRIHCLKFYPDKSLPKLLKCVEWNNYPQVAQMVYLLKKWPLIQPEKALELLDFCYPDPNVREFAVNCLDCFSDEDLHLYLLQLVQSLKHECYHFCALSQFLLKKAVQNPIIGNHFFWLLRSEMSVLSVAVRFGVTLEAFFRQNVIRLDDFLSQMDALEQMNLLTDSIQKKKDSKEKVNMFLQKQLENQHTIDKMSAFLSPLDSTVRCDVVCVDKCKHMDSKMKPLWLVYKNYDPHGDPIFVIFKRGDDLRQDMLTLQMIKIMDKLWKQEGLDFRMNPYSCLPTDSSTGLIEVVLEAETVANIQKEKGIFSATCAFRKGSILAWLKDYNIGANLDQAIQEFTLSCAGYCVATYVLGIADRHSDNIMVKKNGQMFHIDFGHILGHFKEKFGIRRERVPFVLTHDFVHVITRGGTSKAAEFTKFRQYCEKAFLILRCHGNFILSLFGLMISTGLPELASEKDLNYIRETLALDKSSEEAVDHFQQKFDEALKNSWKTSVNWATHNMAKNNN